MGLSSSLAEVRIQDARVSAARRRLPAVGDALDARVRKHPLAWLGAAFGAGYVVERLPVRPWRIPGVLTLLSGGVIELLQQVLARFDIDVDAPTP
jgi:hypothetical protein